ncbi:hypothetical protein J6590_090114 [Homalodisca vitripennis]|nr:hypothetical protein J6590_074527 [Homalodisca vitripennis]KAG8295003.1 hypothetical protein J6590_090114 [Homalodisca vitripennis]
MKGAREREEEGEREGVEGWVEGEGRWGERERPHRLGYPIYQRPCLKRKAVIAEVVKQQQAPHWLGDR